MPQRRRLRPRLPWRWTSRAHRTIREGRPIHVIAGPPLTSATSELYGLAANNNAQGIVTSPAACRSLASALTTPYDQDQL
ncbi:hypothetical protein MPC4_50058 [Methylocella tundrae]|uniref:Uncharacterized protein n=1 Tax=Methylocella tundrae TaxID=227605 RepID=A0A8B6M9Y6_METTU|nr:hypothetical protein MPC4_50058 [Methylocella tundrae]